MPSRLQGEGDRAVGDGIGRMSEQPGTDPTLPADVYASSRSRVPLMTREQMATAEDRAIFDQANNDPRSIMGLRGPAGIGLYSPRVNAFARPLNAYLRFDSGLERTHAEIVMMCAAREMDQPFEWYAHENAGRKEGVSDAVIDTIRYRTPTTGLPEKDAAIIELCRAAIVKHNVSPQTYAVMVALFGVKKTYEIAVLMGQYLSTAVVLHTFAQQLPPGAESTLPMDA